MSPNHVAEDLPLTRDTAQDILDVTIVGPDDFRFNSGSGNHLGNVHGGRLIGQSLYAAMLTVERMPATSVQGNFLAAGRIGRPIEYHVERLRDSRRFANRQVIARQDGQAIFVALCEFHDPEPGFTHQDAVMPDVPAPESLVPLQHFVRDNAAQIAEAAISNFSGPLPIEMRVIEPERYLIRRARKPRRLFWFRLPSAAAISDPRLHQCLIAFSSDYWLAGVAAVPHGLPTNNPELIISSLNHAIWFHRPGRCDEWLLHHTTGPTAGDGIGHSQGHIYDRTGRLLASTAQSGLLRVTAGKAAGAASHS